MQIICPHCTTSYAVDPAKFSAGGRTVRCARCSQTWLAMPQQEAAFAAGPEPDGVRDGWDHEAAQSHAAHDEPPHVESPSISAGWEQDDDQPQPQSDLESDWPEEPVVRPWYGRSPGWLTSLVRPLAHHLDTPHVARLRQRLPAVPAMPLPKISLPIACAAMGAIAAALLFWRADVVRLMPQTAGFFRTVGLGVNLRGLEFDRLKITTENVDGKPVLVIEGAIKDIASKSAELPRLRFIVRNAQGSDIYAWNSVMEQSVIRPGERLTFRSRLASPPSEGREIAVRFFQRRDIAAGGI